jgi:serine/threonine protein kinase
VGFDRRLFAALHPAAASHLEEVLGRFPARPAQAEGVGAEEHGPAERAWARLTDEPPTRYRTEQEIARGGQGSILRVWDGALHRHLAMKVTHAGEPTPGTSDATHVTRSLGRFVEEARVTAQLDHPGIVPVHEFGKDGQGRLYFTMKLVKGRDLKQVIGLVQRGEEGWTQPRALSVLLRVCEGMAYAHSKGVIHRDLKPANVMVGSM